MRKIILALLLAAALPALAFAQQSGNNGAGGSASLPSQVGNSGKFLTTNGTAASWGTPSGSGSVASATGGQWGCYAVTGTTVSGCSLGTGIATWLATPTSANLAAAITDETGTGSAVFGTSPLLNIPVLTGYTTASLPTCNSTTNKYALAVATDGTPSLTFCNGSTWVNNGGTQFTFVATGCTPSASSGDATGGSITLAAGPCTQLVITFNGAVGMTASHLWVCTVSDPSLNGPTSWFGSWGASSSTTTTATIQIPPSVGATDTITFSCEPH